jgi:DNA-binding transcriptional MerR regulator/multidrug transporter EmrE-like cation transporter
MYRVGELSRITNVSIRTLHYYDEIGLLKPSRISEAGYRYYTKDDLVKLQQIIVLKKLGFKLCQIKEMTQVTADKAEKAQRWMEIFDMEIEKIREEKRRLELLERSLHVIRHSLELTGDVSSDEILAIIQSIQLNDADSFLSRHFTEEEQEILLRQLPDLTARDEKTEKWIKLLKKIRQTKSEPIDSPVSQRLAEEIMRFIREHLQMEDSLIDKYWEKKIKPEDGQPEKVIGLDKETTSSKFSTGIRNTKRGAKAMGKKSVRASARWDLFLYHLVLFVTMHCVFAAFFGVQPLSQIGSESYLDHIFENFLNHGVNIYRNPSANEISNIWKSILLIHLILDIIETIFPRKKKTPDRHLQKDEGIVEKAGEKAATDKKPDKNPGAAWVYLLLAGLLEIIWATALKMDMLGGPLILALILSFDLLIKAVRRLGIGTAYAVFTGIGTAGLVLVDIAFFRETWDFLKVFFISLLVLFIIGLKWTSDSRGGSHP